MKNHTLGCCVFVLLGKPEEQDQVDENFSQFEEENFS